MPCVPWWGLENLLPRIVAVLACIAASLRPPMEHPNPMRLQPRLTATLIALATLVLGGCSSTREVDLEVRGVTPMNLNVDQESTPVSVRVFPLASDGKFRAATVDQLWTDHAKTLAEDLLGEPTVITVFPGSADDRPVDHTVTVSSSARFIGLLAMYQKADAQDRRTLILPIDEADDKPILFTGFAVSVETPGSN